MIGYCGKYENVEDNKNYVKNKKTKNNKIENLLPNVENSPKDNLKTVSSNSLPVLVEPSENGKIPVELYSTKTKNKTKELFNKLSDSSNNIYTFFRSEIDSLENEFNNLFTKKEVRIGTVTKIRIDFMGEVSCNCENKKDDEIIEKLMKENNAIEKLFNQFSNFSWNSFEASKSSKNYWNNCFNRGNLPSINNKFDSLILDNFNKKVKEPKILKMKITKISYTKVVIKSEFMS